MTPISRHGTGRHSPPSQRDEPPNLHTDALEITLMKQEIKAELEESDEDENDHDGSDQEEFHGPNITGMFANVDVEVSAEADLMFANENSSCDDATFEADSCGDNDEEPSEKDQAEPKGIIAKLAQKLNSKLNSIMVPRPTESLLACLEPEVSVATEGSITQGGVYVCPWCPVTSMDIKGLEDHKTLCHNSKDEKERLRFTCEVCGEPFSKSWALKRHYYIHTGELPFRCVDCGQRFSTAGHLTVHRKHHHSAKYPKQWICYICKNHFPTKPHLLEHQRRHLDPKSLDCPHCSLKYRLQEELDEHVGAMHSLCQVCGKTFINLSHLWAGHLLSQHKLQYLANSRVFECVQCKEKMTDVQLKHHSCLLSWLRPHQCKSCGESFRGASDLKVHVRIHVGEYPFICCDCGEHFSHKNDLSSHMRTHTGERTYRCKICGKCFMKNSNLREHMNVHKDDKGQIIENDSSNPSGSVWSDKDPAILNKVSEMAKESHAFRTAIAGKLMETGFVVSKKEESANFKDTIAERLKKTGVLSFGNGNVSLSLL